MIRLSQIHPLPYEELNAAIAGIPYVLIVEESSTQASIHDSLALHLLAERIDYLDLGGEYVTHGNTQTLYKHHRLDGESLADFILEVLKVEE